MAILTGGNIPTAPWANMVAGQKASGNEPLTNTVAVAINVAIHAGLFSTTVSVSGISSAFIQDMTNQLQALGYGVSIASTTLTITW